MIHSRARRYGISQTIHMLCVCVRIISNNNRTTAATASKQIARRRCCRAFYAVISAVRSHVARDARAQLTQVCKQAAVVAFAMTTDDRRGAGDCGMTMPLMSCSPELCPCVCVCVQIMEAGGRLRGCLISTRNALCCGNTQHTMRAVSRHWGISRCGHVDRMIHWRGTASLSRSKPAD